jgi:hypothetical protein
MSTASAKETVAALKDFSMSYLSLRSDRQSAQGSNAQIIDKVGAEARHLARLDSPRRIAWLRDKLRDYTRDHAAFHYFRLPTFPDMEGLSHKEHALAGYLNLGSSHGLTPDEAPAAFNGDWDASTKIAVQVGEKLKIAALSQIKLTRNSHGITEALRLAVARFPSNWPFLGPVELEAIAAGFHRATSDQRRAA